jgi:hypothetical protein
MNPIDQKFTTYLAFACILGMSGCGGGGGSAPAPPVTQPPVTPPPVTPPPVTPPPVVDPTPKLSANPIILGSGVPSGAVFWPDGSTASGGRGAVIDNVGCLASENYHIHSHLAIIRNGVMLALPANVGLQGCSYELHTHDHWGVIHVETSVARKFTLGQFFSVWGQPLSKTNIAGITGLPVTVFIDDDGQSVTEYTGNLADIELKPHRSITIQVGSALAEIPSYRWQEW